MLIEIGLLQTHYNPPSLSIATSSPSFKSHIRVFKPSKPARKTKFSLAHLGPITTLKFRSLPTHATSLGDLEAEKSQDFHIPVLRSEYQNLAFAKRLCWSTNFLSKPPRPMPAPPWRLVPPLAVTANLAALESAIIIGIGKSLRSYKRMHYCTKLCG